MRVAVVGGGIFGITAAIAFHDRDNLVVATGGSGHAFKFAPVLGELIASIALAEPQLLAATFRWRRDAAPGAEAARSR